MSTFTRKTRVSLLAENIALYAQGEKRCSLCKEAKSVSEFSKNAAGHFGLDPRCSACKKSIYRDWYKHTILDRRAQKARYRNAHRADIHTRDMSARQRLKFEQPERYAAQLRFESHRLRMWYAIEFAKTSPVNKRYGFNVVITHNGKFRGVALKPGAVLQNGEKALVGYVFNAGLKMWFANRPTVTGVLTTDEKRLVDIVLRRETNNTKGVVSRA